MDDYNRTQIHAVALALTLAMGVAMLVVRRDRVVIPLLIVACFVTHAQRIVVGGLDFSMLRILVLFGWTRVLMRGELRDFRPQLLDKALLLWLLIGTLAYSLGPRGSTGAFIFRLGVMFDAAGIYFLFRVLLRDVRDVDRAVTVFGWIALALAGPMLFEHFTRWNVFAALGGVHEITAIRDGRLRCQASFSHPIMVGNFGASTAALLGALWMGAPRRRAWTGAALLASTLIVILSSSTGPLIAFLSALLGWSVWPLRRSMRSVRWVAGLVILALHLVREKPVWHLIGRISSITGGTGWHRYRLIDEAIAHFDEWWLAGTRTTLHWNLPTGPSDITNQYVLEGVRGGIGTVLSFVAVLAFGFRTVGACVRRASALRALPRFPARQAALLGFGLGVCLFAHSVAFIAVSYFGQLESIFYLQLAMIPSLAAALERVPAPVGSTEHQQRVAERPAPTRGLARPKAMS
jgi:hypothetical protein